MIVAQVIGSAIATLKHDSFKATKLLLLKRADEYGQPAGEVFLAVDLVGAGEGELVVVSQGSSARMAAGQNASHVDAAIVGILDSLEADRAVSFRKE